MGPLKLHVFAKSAKQDSFGWTRIKTLKFPFAVAASYRINQEQPLHIDEVMKVDKFDPERSGSGSVRVECSSEERATAKRSAFRGCIFCGIAFVLLW